MSEPTENTPLFPQSHDISTSDNSQKRAIGSHESASRSYQRHISSSQSALQNAHPYRSLSFMNPTRAAIPFKQRDGRFREKGYVEWRARDNRKGRHTLILPSHYDGTDAPPLSTSASSIRAGIWRMLTVYAYWDISWWIAVFFSVGCALFVVCGAIETFPRLLSGEEPKSSVEINVSGWSAFIGALLFAFGGVFLVIEATNENQTDCFGWAVEETYEQVRSTSDSDVSTIGPLGGDRNVRDRNVRVQHLVPSRCRHSQSNKDGYGRMQAGQEHQTAPRTWRWWPAWHELKEHYFHEIGFLASTILGVGTIIFLVSGIMSLPAFKEVSEETKYATYWLAYFVGGLHFVASSALYMLEVQRHWYLPNIRSLAWWIGFWNLVGSVGWTISASEGYCRLDWCKAQTHFTLLWASVAFLIGSLLLWYESLEKYPVERESALEVRDLEVAEAN